METDTGYIQSEFSMFELLYQHNDVLAHFIETVFNPNQFADPFDLIAAREAQLGVPIAFHKGETDM